MTRPASSTPVRVLSRVEDLPWLTPKRRSVLPGLAAPLFIAAMRRVVAYPLKTTMFDGDFEVLDAGRVTGNRLRSAALWNQMHPGGARPFLHNVRHAGYVLRALGVQPGEVHRLRKEFGWPTDAPDENLLLYAHFAAVTCFPATTNYPSVLHREHNWSLGDLIEWSIRYGFEHFITVSESGFGWTELGDLLRQGQAPDAPTIAMLHALHMEAMENPDEYW